MSATAPAGKVNSVKGSDKTVAISEISMVEASSEFSAQYRPVVGPDANFRRLPLPTRVF